MDFHGEKRTNATHASTIDPDTRLYKKSKGQEAKLCCLGQVLIENRHGLVVNSRLTTAGGRAEWEAGFEMGARLTGPPSRDGRRGQGLRRRWLRGQPPPPECDAARGAEAAARYRPAHYTARWLCSEPARAPIYYTLRLVAPPRSPARGVVHHGRFTGSRDHRVRGRPTSATGSAPS